MLNPQALAWWSLSLLLGRVVNCRSLFTVHGICFYCKAGYFWSLQKDTGFFSTPCSLLEAVCIFNSSKSRGLLINLFCFFSLRELQFLMHSLQIAYSFYLFYHLSLKSKPLYVKWQAHEKLGEDQRSFNHRGEKVTFWSLLKHSLQPPVCLQAWSVSRSVFWKGRERSLSALQWCAEIQASSAFVLMGT